MEKNLEPLVQFTQAKISYSGILFSSEGPSLHFVHDHTG
jgi:hypothetical protein